MLLYKHQPLTPQRHLEIFGEMGNLKVARRAFEPTFTEKKTRPVPIGSMYGIYANIGGILMVNVTIYTIHGSYGV